MASIHRHVVRFRGRAGLVGARRHPGEFAEVVDQVGLVGIAVRGGDFAPIGRGGITDGVYDALQAAYA